MDPQRIKETLHRALLNIQDMGGHPVPDIQGTLCPMTDLPGFDSPNTVECITEIEIELGVEITTNPFLSKKGTRCLNIDETIKELTQPNAMKGRKN